MQTVCAGWSRSGLGVRMNDALIAQFASAAQMLPDRTGRLASLARHAEDRPLRIAAFGGSITFGYYAADPAQKLTAFPALLCDMLPYPTELRNYAAAGTNAWFGLCMAAQEGAQLQPDLVILEYAVNQGVCRGHITAYESLLYRLAALPSAPAVLHVFCVNARGETSAKALEHLAAHYGQAAVSVQNGLSGMPWEEYADDAVHPHRQGQQMLAAAVYEAIRRAVPRDTAYTLPTPCFDRSAANLRLCDLSAGTGGCRTFVPFHTLLDRMQAVYLQAGADTYTLTAEGDAFLLIFRQSCYDDTDDAFLTVDDEPPVRLQANLSCGWGNPYVHPVMPKRKADTHRLTLHHAGENGRFVLWCIAAYRIRKEDTA